MDYRAEIGKSERCEVKLKLEMFLAGLVLGRCVLHFVCACRTGRLKLHWRGVVREFQDIAAPVVEDDSVFKNTR